MEANEMHRLAGKLIGDTKRQRVSAKRYPWKVLREFALAWMAANPSEAGTVTSASLAQDRPATVPATPIEGIPEAVARAVGELDPYPETRAALVALFNGDIDPADVLDDVMNKLRGLELVNDSGGVSDLGAAVARLLATDEEGDDKPTDEDMQKARDLAEHISAAQSAALVSLVTDGHMNEAGKATVGALVNKGLITVHEDPADGADVTALGNLVAAILAGK